MLRNAIQISKGRAADATNIATLSKHEIEEGLGWRWNPTKVIRAISNPRAVVLVAKTPTQFAGFGIMQYYEKRANLNLLAVDRKFRGNGIGSALVSQLQNIALKNDIDNIYVQVREKNKRGIRFYEKLGYEMIDMTKRYYSGKENAVIMYHYLQVEICAQNIGLNRTI